MLAKRSSINGLTMGMLTTLLGVSAPSRSKTSTRILNKLAGNVTFLDQPNAVQKGLTYINGAGNAVVKVDNTTNIEPAPLIHRDSVSTVNYSAPHVLMPHRFA